MKFTSNNIKIGTFKVNVEYTVDMLRDLEQYSSNVFEDEMMFVRSLERKRKIDKILNELASLQS